MAKDPAFLFYPGDASEDTQFMNRLERGCYFDLLKAQKKLGRFTIDQVKKVLGRDFEACWPALELILKREDEHYFIEWIETSIRDRKEYSEKQRKRKKDYWDKLKSEIKPETNTTDTNYVPRYKNGSTVVEPYEDENEIVNEDEIVIREKGGLGGKEKKQEILNSGRWIQSIAMNKKLPEPDVIDYLNSFLADLILKEDFGKPVREIKKHFISWLNIQIAKPTPQSKITRILDIDKQQDQELKQKYAANRE